MFKAELATLALLAAGSVSLSQSPPAEVPSAAAPRHAAAAPAARAAAPDPRGPRLNDPRPNEPRVRGAYLGLATVAAPAMLRRQVSLPEGVGLVVAFVAEDGPAAKAGLEKYDLLHKLNDQILINPQQLAVLVRTLAPGDTVELTVIRQGKSRTLSAVLTESALRPLDALLRDLDASPDAEAPNGRPGDRRPPELDPRHDPMGEAPPFGPDGRLPPAAWQRDNFRVQWSDGQYTIAVRCVQGRKVLLATDPHGHVLYDGPIDSPAQLDRLPAPVRERLKAAGFPALQTAPAASQPTSRPG